MNLKLRSRNILILFTFISIVSLNVIFCFIPDPNILRKEDNARLSASDKITITKNSDWIDLKNDGICTGSGSILDPYIIEDLVIIGNGLGNCISIENSNVAFIIRNCTVVNSGGQTANAGIYFGNVQNGKLVNNNSTLNENGIYFFYSNGNEIKNNVISDNDNSGISLEQSSNNLISGNNVTSNGNYGIRAIGSSNTISGNIANNNGYFEIFAFYSESGYITENTAEGIIIYNSNYMSISENSVSNGVGIVLSHSNYTDIWDNYIDHCTDGIRISESKYNEISGNLASTNSRGISIVESKKNTITENTLINNNYGIHILNSRDNSLKSNSLNFNDVGIYIDSFSACNELSNNIFTGNGEDVLNSQGPCLPEIPIFQIILIALISISVIIAITVIIRKRSIKHRVPSEKEAIELIPLKQEEEMIIQKQEVKTPSIESEKIEVEQPLESQTMVDFKQEETKSYLKDEHMQKEFEEPLKVLPVKEKTFEVKEEFIEAKKVEEAPLDKEIIQEIIEKPVEEGPIKEKLDLSEEERLISVEKVTSEELLIEKVEEEAASSQIEGEIVEKEAKLEEIQELAVETGISEITCRYCGFENEDDARFCVQCGQVIKNNN